MIEYVNFQNDVRFILLLMMKMEIVWILMLSREWKR